MMDIIHRDRSGNQQPWTALLSFLFTVILATYEHWSAQDLAWSFWLAGLLFGLIYVVVYHVAQRDSEAWLLYLFLLFFYFIFAGFLDTVFSWMAWDMTGADMPIIFSSVPSAIVHAARERWPFLVASAISVLPDYILDARTVNFTNLGKPLFARDFFRMFVLLFFLVPLMMLDLGVLALYPILLVYFLPLESLRQIAGQLWGLVRGESL